MVNKAFPLFVVSTSYNSLGWSHLLKACEAPGRTRLLLCSDLVVFSNEILRITQVETPAGVSSEISGFQLASDLCQVSTARGEAVTSPKPHVHLS